MTVGQGLVSWKGPEFPRPDLEFLADTRPHVQQSIGIESFGTLKGKGRSYSCPFPQSVLDIVPHGNSDIFVPVPVALRNIFDGALPRELKLQVFSALVALYEAEFQRWKESGQWTVLRASSSKYRWVGRDRGMRELVKLSRVSPIPSVLHNLQ
jgi:F-box/leucine-rich repeat protein 2/20